MNFLIFLFKRKQPLKIVGKEKEISKFLKSKIGFEKNATERRVNHRSILVYKSMDRIDNQIRLYLIGYSDIEGLEREIKSLLKYRDKRQAKTLMSSLVNEIGDQLRRLDLYELLPKLNNTYNGLRTTINLMNNGKREKIQRFY